MWMGRTEGRLVLSLLSDDLGSSGGWMEGVLEKGTAFGMATLTTLLAVEDTALFTPHCGCSSTMRLPTFTDSRTANRQWVHVEWIWLVTKLTDGNALSCRVVGVESACHSFLSNQFSKYTLQSTITRQMVDGLLVHECNNAVTQRTGEAVGQTVNDLLG